MKVFFLFLCIGYSVAEYNYRCNWMEILHFSRMRFMESAQVNSDNIQIWLNDEDNISLRAINNNYLKNVYIPTPLDCDLHKNVLVINDAILKMFVHFNEPVMNVTSEFALSRYDAIIFTYNCYDKAWTKYKWYKNLVLDTHYDKYVNVTHPNMRFKVENFAEIVFSNETIFKTNVEVIVQNSRTTEPTSLTAYFANRYYSGGYDFTRFATFELSLLKCVNEKFEVYY